MSQRAHPTTFGAMCKDLWVHRSLLWQMTQREVVGRYRGSMMGMAWSFFNPVLMLAVYTFIFSFVMNMRWGDSGGSRVDFALMLFCGMIMFNVFSECINRAPTLVVSNVSYVKKVVFPLQIMPWPVVGASLFHGLVSLAALLILFIVANGVPHLTLLWLPLILVPLLLISIGLSWFLAALGVYLRDIQHVVPVLTTVLFFMTPILYPISKVPESVRWILELNPMAVVVEQTRAVVILGESPNFLLLAVFSGIGLAVAWLGYAWFQKCRNGFADVL